MTSDPKAEATRDAILTEILRCTVGSELHGIHAAGQEDHDEMGVAIEHPEWVLGLRRFEQIVERTAGGNNRSGPDDTDLVIYSLRKFARLAASGNPSILVLLFAPPEFVLHATEMGATLQAAHELFASTRAGNAFLGYMTQQRERMQGVRGGKHTNRPELVERYGFDTKYAMHMLRLGVQGREYLSTGRMTLPLPEPYASSLLDVRLGKYTMQETLDWAVTLERDVKRLLQGGSPLPPEPDRAAIEHLLVSAYRQAWA